MIATLTHAPAESACPGQSIKDILQELASTVSASRLGCFHTCRLKFFFRYVLQIVKPATVALVVGKAVHGMLQAWNLARWRGRPQPSLDELLERVWSDPDVQGEIRWDGEEESHKQTTRGLVETYLKETPIPADEKPEAVEAMVEADLAIRGRPRLIGILDLVRPGGLIVDFKTCGQTPNPERSAQSHELQLTAYAVLYRAATGRKESGLELHHLVKLKTPKTVIVPIEAVTPNQERRFFRAVESYLEGLARQDFVPSPGMACLTCEFFSECRAWSGNVEGRLAA